MSDQNKIVSNEELILANLMEIEALRRVLVKKNLITESEVFEKVKEVKKEMEDKIKRMSKEN